MGDQRNAPSVGEKQLPEALHEGAGSQHLQKQGRPQELDHFRPVSMLIVVCEVYAAIMKGRALTAEDRDLPKGAVRFQAVTKYDIAILWCVSRVELLGPQRGYRERSVLRLGDGVRQDQSRGD